MTENGESIRNSLNDYIKGSEEILEGMYENVLEHRN